MISEDKARQALSTVIDPDIGINIVDLGLVEHIKAEGGGVEVALIMTTPACPQGAYLQDESVRALTAAGAASAKVEILASPLWDNSRMSPSARTAMGWEE